MQHQLMIFGIAVIFFVLYLMKFKPLIALFLCIKDYIMMDKKKFRGYGFWLFCGLGGSGKTISMVEYLNRMKKKYPKVKIYTNFNYAQADGSIHTWQDIIDIDNGDEGVIFGFDEIHLTFASQDWQNCPSNMLDYISQQRKLHKQIVASSQVFTRVDKKLREQTNFVIECKSLFLGRWVFNKAFNTAEYLANDEKGDRGARKRHRAWRYNFIAYASIRNSYDTMQLMKELSKGKSLKEQRKDALLDLLDGEL
ncbi:hypothetical protein LI142_08720 [Eubacterium limosum]|uniref:Zona occludens toxin N-terminal domain-containing protein n=1 Tax=Eubacterium limosum TaxID=1736 RepID=A0ABT5ULB9_EUBLI|nr:hypothetical protein [Eubacterium limosum]MCB6569576.1 hypothetical protein [Eubacterium limosum]MDE1469254.1 hypothetical protein [Eubacterium limosum]